MMNTLASPIPSTAVHLCVDMQNIFAPGGIWETPWMERVLPVVAEIADRHADCTIFTRFITPETPDGLPGMWKPYYQKWREATRAILDPGLLELLPELKRLVPPAGVIDKTRYSAFAGTPLHQMLKQRGADTLIITGSETDVCVLSSVLSAVDFGYRTIVVTDAICSSSDEGHDALMKVYNTRYSIQVETAAANEVLGAWNRS